MSEMLGTFSSVVTVPKSDPNPPVLTRTSSPAFLHQFTLSERAEMHAP